MDVIGNFVNTDGESMDKYGNIIQTRSYFEFQGEITIDEQREGEYTKLLGKKISDVYLTHNLILPTHLLSFICVNLLKSKFANPDIYDILRMPKNDWTISFEAVCNAVSDCIQIFKKELISKTFLLSDHFNLDEKEFVEHALQNAGAYHVLKPIFADKARKNLIINDLPVVIFYGNRLVEYDLNSTIKWNKYL
jgi:glycerol-3-phosphate O-acyltransferase